jgi:predicted RNA-binding protein with TRAM domain
MALQEKKSKGTFSAQRRKASTTQVLRKPKKLKVGDICLLRISALGPKGIGIDEYSFPYSVFVPNTNLGETVKVKIVKTSLKEDKYAVAQALDVVKKASVTAKPTVKPDEILTVNIEKLTSKGAGLVSLKEGSTLIIPNAKIGNDVKVIVTRLKSKYAFAKPVVAKEQRVENQATNSKKATVGETPLLESSKLTLTLPAIGKYFGKYCIVKLQGSVLFIKLSLGAKAGDKVRIKISKVNSKFAIAKIVKINPTSLFKKRILVQNSIRQMVKNGMHLGEQAVKCNARMKNYVWLKKRGQNQNRP